VPAAGSNGDRFWKRFAIFAAILLLFVPACTIVGLVVPACAHYRSLQYKGPMITEQPSAATDDHTNGRVFAYRLTAPPGQRLKLWMEIWRDGVPVIPAGFTQMFEPAAHDQPLETQVRLSIIPGEKTSPTATEQMRVEWQLTASGATVSESAWLPLWSKGLSMSYATWGLHRQRVTRPGKATTLLALFANKDTLSVTETTDSAQLRTGNPKAALLLKARFEKMSGEKSAGPLWTTGNAQEETQRLLDTAPQ
jgi:hypothetical protein